MLKDERGIKFVCCLVMLDFWFWIYNVLLLFLDRQVEFLYYELFTSCTVGNAFFPGSAIHLRAFEYGLYSRLRCIDLRPS